MAIKYYAIQKQPKQYFPPKIQRESKMFHVEQFFHEKQHKNPTTSDEDNRCGLQLFVTKQNEVRFFLHST